MDRQQLADAIRARWTRETSFNPEEWTDTNPARDQCDITSLVVMHYLGGDAQLATVSVDGEQLGYHYWNQLTASESLDLTRDQFSDEELIADPELVKRDFIIENFATARQQLRDRHAAFSAAVAGRLAAAGIDARVTAVLH